MIQMLVRFAIEAVCLNELERTLAQGEPSPAALASMQSLLEDEHAQPLWFDGIRGERAMSFQALEFIRKNNNGGTGTAVAGAFPIPAQNGLLAKVVGFVLAPFAGSIEANQIKCQETLTVNGSHEAARSGTGAFRSLCALAKDWRQPALFPLLAVSKLPKHTCGLARWWRFCSPPSRIGVRAFGRTS